MRRIAVIGGGLSGLTVAYRRSRAGDQVTLIEASDRLGGQLHTEISGDLVVEHGAEGFVAGSEAVRVLAADLGIEAALVGQLVSKSYGFDGRELRALAPGEAATLLGFQVPRGELGKGIGSFRRGMGELAETLSAAIAGRVEVRHSPVIDVERADSAWRIRMGGAPTLEAHSVVVATGARAAAPILAPVFGAEAAALAESKVVSSLTVSLAYPRDAIDHPLDGTGFVVAESAQKDGFRACTFTSSKLPERAPAGVALLRLFFRPSDDDLRLSDAAAIERAERCLERAIPTRARPTRGFVSRWPDALPVFDDAHRARVSALEAVLAASGVVLCGSAFHGSGIDAGVRSAERVAAGLG